MTTLVIILLEYLNRLFFIKSVSFPVACAENLYVGSYQYCKCILCMFAQNKNSIFSRANNLN